MGLVDVRDERLTLRQIGAAGVKLIGVYFAATAVLGIGNLLTTLTLPGTAGMPGPREMALDTGLFLVANILVAATCLFGGDAIARRFFSDARIDAGRLTRRDLLIVGIWLLGCSMVLSGVPAIIEMVVKALWYAEGSRHAMFWPMMRQSWDSAVAGVPGLIVGAVTVTSARRIATWLDSAHP